jgi:hypothetical protein
MKGMHDKQFTGQPFREFFSLQNQWLGDQYAEQLAWAVNKFDGTPPQPRPG